jgi:hypothetical protein
MPVLNIEKFSIRPATRILCAMKFDPRRNIDQGAGPGSVHREILCRVGGVVPSARTSAFQKRKPVHGRNASKLC